MAVHNWLSETDESTAESETVNATINTTDRAEDAPKTARKKASRRPSQPKRSEALMREYGITWGTHNGKRVLNIPSKAPAHAEGEVRDALRREA